MQGGRVAVLQVREDPWHVAGLAACTSSLEPCRHPHQSAKHSCKEMGGFHATLLLRRSVCDLVQRGTVATDAQPSAIAAHEHLRPPGARWSSATNTSSCVALRLCCTEHIIFHCHAK